MASCGLLLLSPPWVPLPLRPSRMRDTSNVGRLDAQCLCGFVTSRGVIRLEGFQIPYRRWGNPRTTRASTEENLETSNGPVTTSTSENEKEELALKLAAAEAEAEALRKELDARRSSRNAADLSKLKPGIPEKRIDGTGYRETIFSGRGNTTGTPEQQPSKWGLSEAELFLSKGAPTEGTGLGGEAMEPGTSEIVSRRLAIGIGLTVLAVGLAFFKLPTGRPSKPLFLYMVSILRLQEQLKSLEDSASDADVVRKQLQRAGTPEEIKNNFLSAAAWLDGEESERASSLAYNIFEYLDQADYNKYFENFGQPTTTQQVEFLKFSLQSIKAARQKVEEFLTLIPRESLDAAQGQWAR